MYKRVTLQAVQTVQEAMLFGAHLINCCRLGCNVGFIDPLSMAILKRLDRYSLGTCCLLALSTLRYSDLRSVDIRSYLSGYQIGLRQGKTETYVKLPRLPDEVVEYSSSIEIPPAPFPASYSSVRYSLNNAITRSVREHLTEQMSVTHIFRHLRASYLSSQDLPISEIGLFLGHSMEASTRCYIHDSLIDVFQKHR